MNRNAWLLLVLGAWSCKGCVDPTVPCQDGDDNSCPAGMECVNQKCRERDGGASSSGSGGSGLVLPHPDGGSLQISSAGFSMTLDAEQCFAPSSWSGLPSDPTNLLYTWARPERLAGVSHWENLFSWNCDSKPTVVEAVNGPLVAQLNWHWVANRDPSGTSTDQTFSGDTQYTIHADGRVFRWERATYGNGAPSFLLAYAAWDPQDLDGFRGVDRPGQPAHEIDPGSEYIPESAGASATCAYSSSKGHALGWAHHGCKNQQCRLRVALKNEVDAGASLLMASDWISNGADADGGSPPADADVQGHFLMMLDNHSNCTEVLRALEEFMDPPPLVPGRNVTRVEDSPGDADHDGYVEAGGYYYLDVSTGGGGAPQFMLDGQGDAAWVVLRLRNAPGSASPKLKDIDTSDPDPQVQWQSTAGQDVWARVTSGLTLGRHYELRF